MRSQQLINFLEESIISIPNNNFSPTKVSVPQHTASGDISFTIDTSYTVNVSMILMSINASTKPDAVYIQNSQMEYVSTIGNVLNYKFTSVVSPKTITLLFHWNDSATHTVKIFELNGLRSSTVQLGNIVHCTSSSGRDVNVNASTYRYFEDLSLGSSIADFINSWHNSITVFWRTDNIKGDFLSARFYVTAGSVNVTYNDSGGLNQFERLDQDPLINASLGTAYDYQTIASIPGAEMYISTTTASYFGTGIAVCYDITVDISHQNITNPYYTLTIEIDPSTNKANSAGNLVFTYEAQFNGAAVGYYDEDPNEIALYVQWYETYINTKINELEAVISGNLNSFQSSFESYMDQILEILGSGAPALSGAQEAMDNAGSLEASAVGDAAAASSTITSMSAPAQMLATAPVFTLISNGLFGSDGLLPLFTMLVLIPLAIGIISKLINGGD